MKRTLLIIAITLALVPLLKSSASGSPFSAIGPVVSSNRGLNVDLWSDRNQDEVYYPGESVDIYFRANNDCFVSIYSIGSDGDVELLFPQYPDEGFVFGGMTYRLPEYYDDWNYRISGPTGVEYIQAVASRTPRAFRYGSRNGRYHLGFDPVVGDPFIAINAINNRMISSSRIHATATLSFFVGSRVWYPRYMCYDCHGRSARFDPYGADCSRYSVQLAHDYDYWWAYDYHPVSSRFVFGGPFWRFEMRSAHRPYRGSYLNCALGHRNYHPIRVIKRRPQVVVYKSPKIKTRRSYQSTRERVTYSETKTRTVQRNDGTRVRTTGSSRTTTRNGVVATPGSSSRSRSESSSAATPGSRSRSESSSAATPGSRSRSESSSAATPGSRSRSESSSAETPGTRSRSESSSVTTSTRNISVPSSSSERERSIGRSTPASTSSRPTTQAPSSATPSRGSSTPSASSRNDDARGSSSRESGSSSGSSRSVSRPGSRSR